MVHTGPIVRTTCLCSFNCFFLSSKSLLSYDKRSRRSLSARCSLLIWTDTTQFNSRWQRNRDTKVLEKAPHEHKWPSRALPSKNKPVPGSQMVERKKIAGGGGDTGAGANPQSPAPVSPGPLLSQLYFFFLSTIWEPGIGYQKISHCCHHSPTRSLPKAALCTGCGYHLPAWRLRRLSVQNVP